MNPENINVEGKALTTDPKILQARVDFYGCAVAICQGVESALWTALRALAPRAEFEKFQSEMKDSVDAEIAKLVAHYKEVTGENVF